MPNYRRLWMPGGTYFFTVTTFERRPILTREDAIAALRSVIADVRRRHPFTINAWVVLPDHMHTVWTLPEADADFPKRWALIKTGVSRRLAPALGASSRFQRRLSVWQPRYWEHWIRDDADRAAHIDYVHFNPVRHRLVTEVADWPYSTFHRYVRDGLYLPSWAKEPDISPPE
jgi:putative transposase